MVRSSSTTSSGVFSAADLSSDLADDSGIWEEALKPQPHCVYSWDHRGRYETNLAFENLVLPLQIITNIEAVNCHFEDFRHELSPRIRGNSAVFFKKEGS